MRDSRSATLTLQECIATAEMNSYYSFIKASSLIASWVSDVDPAKPSKWLQIHSNTKQIFTAL